MSDNPSQREHIHRVMLNAVFYVGVSKLMAKLECSKSAAVLYALNEGLFRLELIEKKDYELLAERYSRKLVEVIEETRQKRESSHVPVLTIQQRKEQLLLLSKDQQFRGMIDQWTVHETNWRTKAVADAEKWKDKLQSAKDLLELSRKTGSASCEETLKKMMTGEFSTCVADDLPAIQTDFALKVSTENVASDVTGADALSLTQILHV